MVKTRISPARSASSSSRACRATIPTYMLAMACAKHYAVHSGPEADRHRFNAQPSERDLYEMYLPQFERVVREGKVAGVMSAYNAVNGVPCCASPFLLNDLLRKQWGFDGYVVSDCDAIRDIWGQRQHHYVKTPEEAAAAAVKAGCNLCCGGDYNALVRAVQQGLVTRKGNRPGPVLHPVDPFPPRPVRSGREGALYEIHHQGQRHARTRPGRLWRLRANLWCC